MGGPDGWEATWVREDGDVDGGLRHDQRVPVPLLHLFPHRSFVQRVKWNHLDWRPDPVALACRPDDADQPKSNAWCRLPVMEKEARRKESGAVHPRRCS